MPLTSPDARLQQGGQPLGRGTAPGWAFGRPAARGRVVVGSGLRTVVPPAPVPEALEQRGRMAGEELAVKAEGLGEQLHEPGGRVRRRKTAHGRVDVSDEVEHLTGFGPGFEEEEIQEERRYGIPVTGLDGVVDHE